MPDYDNWVLYLTGLAVFSLGFQIQKTSIGRTLRNPLYYGGIRLKAFKDEPEQIVKGLHEPIVSKALFDKVQKVIDPNNQHSLKHKKVNPNFPLKDFLQCPACGRKLLASFSKGSHSSYPYYHCASPCKIRYNATKADGWFKEFLANISLDEQMQNLVIEMLKKRFNQLNEENQIGPKHHQRKLELREKLNKARDLYLEGEFSKTEYQETKLSIEKEQKQLEEKETNFEQSKGVFDIYKEGIKRLQNLDNEFSEADIHNKRLLIRSIIGPNFQFEDKKIRTIDINPLLFQISSIDGGSRGNKKRTNQKKLDLSRPVQAERLELSHLAALDPKSSVSTNSTTPAK